jgi:hypothetical protein
MPGRKKKQSCDCCEIGDPGITGPPGPPGPAGVIGIPSTFVVAGSTVPGDLAMFADSNGVLQDSGIASSDVLLQQVDIFGDGSDGNITWTGGGTITLTSNVYARNITISGSGTTINPNNFAVYAQGTLSMAPNTFFRSDGGNGANGTASAGGTAGAGPFTTTQTNGGLLLNFIGAGNGGGLNQNGFGTTVSSTSGSAGGSPGNGGNSDVKVGGVNNVSVPATTAMRVRFKSFAYLQNGMLYGRWMAWSRGCW